MKKILAVLFIVLFIPLCAFADGRYYAKPASAACSPPGCENFNSDGTPSNWTTSGTVNFDYTTDPLEGAQSLFIEHGANTKYDQSLGWSEGYFTFWIKHTENPDELNYVFRIGTDTIGNAGQFIFTRPSNFWGCYIAGGASPTYGGDSSAGASVQKMKMYYKKGTGGSADAIVTVWEWNGSSWDQACTVTDGNDTGNIDNINFINVMSSENVIIDMLKASQTDIANPD
jgi:hypothetical protein